MVKQGPSLGPNIDSPEEVERQVRIWLDSWIVPNLEKISRACFPPTDAMVNNWLVRQPKEVQDRINDEAFAKHKRAFAGLIRRPTLRSISPLVTKIARKEMEASGE